MKFVIKKDRENEEVELYLEQDKDNENEVNLKCRYRNGDGELEEEYLMSFKDGKFHREEGDISEETGVKTDDNGLIKERK